MVRTTIGERMARLETTMVYVVDELKEIKGLIKDQDGKFAGKWVEGALKKGITFVLVAVLAAVLGVVLW